MAFLFSKQRAALAAVFLVSALCVRAACTGCTSFEAGVVWGNATFNALSEASGIASSRRNAGVLWTHNDGSAGVLYALSTNGTRLATFDLTKKVDDVEDIAAGPGPANGVSYLYVGDIGGNVGTNSTRPDVKVARVAEPPVDLAWASNPRSLDFDDVDTFTLVYPDGSFDAETLMVDPLTADLFVATKENNSTRIYRANLNTAADKAIIVLEFVRSVAFDEPSAGDISPDGTQILLRNENSAVLWQRCDGESISSAFGRAGQAVPVIGPPVEPNGEGVAFLADGSGYLTISETNNPAIYFFQATCPRGPVWLLTPADQTGFVGGTVRFHAAASGYPAPVYTWSLGGQLLAGETNSILQLSNVSIGGQVQVTASNSSGIASATATLTVRAKPDLRITEVMSSPASSPGVPTGDWWELTSFESQPVSLSGWRFNDSGGGLADPFTIAGALVIAPGESIVFVEGLTVAQFTNWWGGTNLPAAVQIVTYTGAGLSLGAGGDGVRLWDNVTSEINNTIASADFGAATAGVSFNYDPALNQFGALSQLGVNGVVRAALASDIGSPGRIAAPPARPVLRGVRTNDQYRIEFDAVAGVTYVLEMQSDLGGAWTPAGDTFHSTTNAKVSFEKELTAGNRFYRVRAD